MNSFLLNRKGSLWQIWLKPLNVFYEVGMGFLLYDTYDTATWATITIVAQVHIKDEANILCVSVDIILTWNHVKLECKIQTYAFSHVEKNSAFASQSCFHFPSWYRSSLVGLCGIYKQRILCFFLLLEHRKTCRKTRMMLLTLKWSLSDTGSAPSSSPGCQCQLISH